MKSKGRSNSEEFWKFRMVRRLIYLIFICNNALAELDSHDQTDEQKLTFTAAIHYTYTDLSNLYEINSGGVKDATSNFQPGIELGLLYPISSGVFGGSTFYVEPNYVYFSDHKADVFSLCNNQLCYKNTSMKHQALMLNFHWQVFRNEKSNLNLFVGPAYYWFEGEVASERWSDEAIGYQVGLKSYLNITRKFNPFFGLRVSGYDLDALDQNSLEKEISYILGLHF